MSFVKIWIHAVWAVKNRKPVLNQEKHHKNKSWEDEYNEFITKYGFQIIKG